VSGHFIPDGVGPLLPVVYKDEPFDVTPYYSEIAAGGGNNWAAMLAACHKRKAWAYELEMETCFPLCDAKEKRESPYSNQEYNDGAQNRTRR
jgi:hypothetical protein